MNNKWKLKLPTQLLQKINYVKKISLQKKNRKIEKLVKTMKQKKKTVKESLMATQIKFNPLTRL